MSDLSIEIIRKCNNCCRHCSSCSTSSSTEMLDLSQLRGIAEDVSRLDVDRVCLSGGEPLLHPDILDIVRIFSEAGKEVVVYTCGIVGSPDALAPISRSYARRLKTAGISTAIFNFPAARSGTYDFITSTKGRFPILLDSVRAMAAAEIRCEGHFVPLRQNVDEIEEVLTVASDVGITKMSFLRLVAHGRAQEHIHEIGLSECEERSLINDLAMIKSAHNGRVRIGIPLSREATCSQCHAISGKLYVKFDGSIYGCEAFKYVSFSDEEGKSLLPLNIKDCSLSEALERSEHLLRSKELIERHAALPNKSETCPVQEYLRNGGRILNE